MLGHVRASADLWRTGIELGRAAPTPAIATRGVVVAGMGGSGIAADVAVVAGATMGRAPVVAVKSYDLPAFVGAGTLVVLVSQSGDTEETLAVADATLASPASAFVVASGGRLAAVAAEHGLPMARVPGDRMPRASLPLLVAPVLVALERAEALAGVDAMLDGVPDVVEADLAAAEVRAAELADAVGDRIPVFVGARGWSGLVAARAMTQVHENAERVAFAAELPELDHNAIVGLAAAHGTPLAIVFIGDPGDHPRIRTRIDLTAEVIARAGLPVHTITLTGPSPLARAAAGIQAVDLLSVELAFRGGVDPTPIAVLEELKQRLRSAARTSP